MTRLDAVLRLRTRWRERAATDLATREAEAAALDRERATARVTEAAARILPAEVSAATLAVAAAHADALARRALALLDAGTHARTSAERARETLRARRRDEQQVVRLAARRNGRIGARLARDTDRGLDELALRAHARRFARGRRS